MAALDDPAHPSRVPPQLLLHLHLIADHRYPIVQTAGLDFTLERLLEAQKIVHDVSPLSWKFLDCPQEGFLFLEYQSPNAQNQFASDGYLWGGKEQFFRQEYHGYLIEMQIHNFGFAPTRENRQGPAVHSRRRYRLVPNPNNPSYNCNSNLWIVHYQHAQSLMPASQVPVGPAEHHMLEQRRILQSHGHLMENRFMLGDRNNWPTIVMPNTQPQRRVPGPMIGFTSQMAPATARQQMVQPGYSTDHPPKRARTGTAGAKEPMQQRLQQQPDPRSALEQEEEDYKDLHDYMTQRDISQMRYVQHHEWMEEVYSSYPTFSIKPVSLGLGRKGELEPLTNGFFDPPRPPTPESSIRETTDEHYDTTIQKPLEHGKAEEFYVRATNKISQLSKDLEEMKLTHQKRMESFAKIKALRNAEKSLRGTVAGGDESMNSEAAKVEGGPSQMYNPASGDATIAALRQMEQIDIIAKEVENLTGKKVSKFETIKLLQKGGLVEDAAPTAEKSRSGSGVNTSGDMASIFDDFLEPGAGERSLLGSNQPSTKPSTSPQPVPAGTDRPMTGQIDGAADDWVMVDKQDSQSRAASAGAPDAPISNAASAGETTTTAALAMDIPPQESTPVDQMNNDGDLGTDLVDFGGDEANETHFEGGAFEDAIDFGDLNTPGDGMEGLGGDDGGADTSLDVMGDGLDTKDANLPDMAIDVAQQNQVTGDEAAGAGDAQQQVQIPHVPVQVEALEDSTPEVNEVYDPGTMDIMEDSAFGDAFHHTEAEAEEK